MAASCLWVLVWISQVPSAAAVDPAEAVATWNMDHPSRAGWVESVQVIQEGAHVTGTITFTDQALVANVSYQICRVGEACFATGLPLAGGPKEWTFTTEDIPRLVPAFQEPPRLRGGEEIGVQFFVHVAENGTEDPLLSPHGLPQDDARYESDHLAWSRSHYYTVTIHDTQGAAALPVLLVAAVLFTVGSATRWRTG